MRNSKSPSLILKQHVVHQRVIVQWDGRVNWNSFPTSSERMTVGIYFIMVSVSAGIDSGWDVCLAFTSRWLIFQHKSRYIFLLLIERILWGASYSSGFFYDPIRCWEVDIIQYLRTKWISRDRFLILHLYIVQIISQFNSLIFKYCSTLFLPVIMICRRKTINTVERQRKVFPQCSFSNLLFLL